MRVARRLATSVTPSAFAGFRFPLEVIILAVRWYLRFGLSYRDVEELMAERGIQVDHVSVFRWVQRFTPLLAQAARPCQHRVGDRWWVDETYVKVSGRWRYVYRAIDQFGQGVCCICGGRGRADCADATPPSSRPVTAVRLHGVPVSSGRDHGCGSVVSAVRADAPMDVKPRRPTG
jgi:hypothetical protein